MDTPWSLSPEVVVTVLEDSAVLLDLSTKYFYSVNPSGWAIIQLLEAGATRNQILTRCRAWGAPPGDSAATDFLESVIKENLAVPGAASPAPGVSYAHPWQAPILEKHQAPLERIVVSAFDPSLPLAE